MKLARGVAARMWAPWPETGAAHPDFALLELRDRLFGGDRSDVCHLLLLGVVHLTRGHRVVVLSLVVSHL